MSGIISSEFQSDLEALVPLSNSQLYQLIASRSFIRVIRVKSPTGLLKDALWEEKFGIPDFAFNTAETIFPFGYAISPYTKEFLSGFPHKPKYFVPKFDLSNPIETPRDPDVIKDLLEKGKVIRENIGKGYFGGYKKNLHRTLCELDAFSDSDLKVFIDAIQLDNELAASVQMFQFFVQTGVTSNLATISAVLMSREFLVQIEAGNLLVSKGVCGVLKSTLDS